MGVTGVLAREFSIEEWEAITMEEIRARIAQMPDRCRQVVETDGKAIKSWRW